MYPLNQERMKKVLLKLQDSSYRYSLYWGGNQSRNVFLGKIRILVVSRPFKKLGMSVIGIFKHKPLRTMHLNTCEDNLHKSQ